MKRIKENQAICPLQPEEEGTFFSISHPALAFAEFTMPFTIAECIMCVNTALLTTTMSSKLATVIRSSDSVSHFPFSPALTLTLGYNYQRRKNFAKEKKRERERDTKVIYLQQSSRKSLLIY